MRAYLALAGALVTAASLGCDSGPKSGRGLRLPDGDVEKGKVVFVELKCNSCHTVHQVELPVAEKPAEAIVTLGGKVRKVRSYGELVTAIVNPSHELAKGYPEEKVATDGKSLMANFNDVMTVTQLLDLVGFLHSRYERVEPDYPTYLPHY